MLTQKRLKELLHYNPDTGIFITLRPINKWRIGDAIGRIDYRGYLFFCIDYKGYRLHRLAWFYMFGVWPDEIDHINGIKSDNRISNLRNANRQINMQNEVKPRRNNKSGVMGARYRKDTNKWTSRIRINNKYVNLGQFNTAQEAHNAYIAAKRLYHPGFTL